jgi:hypothetical protein
MHVKEIYVIFIHLFDSGILKMLLHLSIFYEYQQFFQHRICFSIQPPDYSDPCPTLARSTSVEKTVDTHKILINAITFYACLQEI